MGGAPPTTVILSTVAWTPVIDELAAQIGPEDEVFVCCDAATDPIAEREADVPDGVSLVVAGEPEGCSGKANAVAAGMEAASHDRIVWTDDDFHHPPDWLDRLHADYDEHGPVSELPFFEGEDVLSVLLEPHYAMSNYFGMYGADQPWGGAVMFDRADVEGGVDALLADLRRTISDDGLLGEYVDVTTLRRTRTVGIGGSLRVAVERHVRFTQIVYRHAPLWFALSWIALLVVAAVGAVALPHLAIPFWTVLVGGVYAAFGVRRWTFLLAYPSVLVYPPLVLYGLARRTFVWGGRRYRWPSLYEVDIVG